MTIQDNINQLVTEFNIFDDWLDKYNYLIDLGKTIPMIDDIKKVESNLIIGCQSRVWLNAEMRDGKLFFTADSDAVITKGIANLLLRVFNDQTPDDILSAPTDFIKELGLTEHLSPTRSNGLLSMIKQIKLYALAFKTKSE